MPEDGNRHHEGEHGRNPAGERVDEGDLARPVRVRERDDVDDLEQRRGQCVGPDGPLGVPPDHRDGRGKRQREHERRGGGRLHVARAGEKEVPRRVQDRGAQRERQSG